MTPTNLILKERLEAILKEHDYAFRRSFEAGNLNILLQMARGMEEVLRAGGKILLCGNGGSAADSQHIAAEFVVRFKTNRQALSAIALTTDTSILTATGNDIDFDHIFSRQIEALGREGDLLIAISTSGNSRNIIQAAARAKERGLRVYSFTNEDGGQLAGATDLNFYAGSRLTSHAQEMHITALHAISELVEDAFAAREAARRGEGRHGAP